MSYSRWSNSTWYTFWSSSRSSNAHSRQEEQFACLVDFDTQFHWPYDMVCQFLEDRSILEQILSQAEPTEEEITELLEYMKHFIGDVDLHYHKKMTEIRGGQ